MSSSLIWSGLVERVVLQFCHTVWTLRRFLAPEELRASNRTGRNCYCVKGGGVFVPAGGTVAVSVSKLKVRVCTGLLDLPTACKKCKQDIKLLLFFIYLLLVSAACGLIKVVLIHFN